MSRNTAISRASVHHLTEIRLLRRSFVWPIAATSLCFGLAPSLEATPQFARSTGRSCISCHIAPPKLNQWGEAFRARGYRLPDDAKSRPTVPFAVWLTGRYEDRSPGDLQEFYLPKVELISGGRIGDLPLSYFVEWRVVSLDLRSNGTLRDRGGRFEDAFINWEINDRNALTVGQFRSLNQYDVSLRLSVSEPVVFSASLPGAPSSNSRIQGLRGFAPSGRSPGLTYTLRSIDGPLASDGLFHFVNVPFVGELSLPLSEEARREASFELEGPAKGVFLETFYRRKLNSNRRTCLHRGRPFPSHRRRALQLQRPLPHSSGWNRRRGGPSFSRPIQFRSRILTESIRCDSAGDRISRGANHPCGT